MVKYYQTIPELNIVGRMDTPKEYDKIGMPERIEGNVLDIGCNIGAFMFEALYRGADYATGVEPNDLWRRLAYGVLAESGYENKKDFELIRYLRFASQKQYDLVLLLSVTHVAEGISGQELVELAWKKTAEGGLMIVEINDRLQEEDIKLPNPESYGKNKDNRSVYHCEKKDK